MTLSLSGVGVGAVRTGFSRLSSLRRVSSGVQNATATQTAGLDLFSVTIGNVGVRVDTSGVAPLTVDIAVDLYVVVER